MKTEDCNLGAPQLSRSAFLPTQQQMLQQPMSFLNEADSWFHVFLSDNELAWSNCAGVCPSNTISHFLSTISADQINPSVTLFKEICSVMTTDKQNLQKTKLNKASYKSIFWVFTSGRHDTRTPHYF